MKKKITLFSILFALLVDQNANAQCPVPSGMAAFTTTSGTDCNIIVTRAISLSTVEIFNSTGSIAFATANSSGVALFTFPCSDGPVTNIISSTSAGFCNTFTISAGTSLPIKLTSFSAQLSVQNTVQLKWETSFELNNEKFEIERSADGISYTRLASLPGGTFGAEKRAYSYEDKTFSSGAISYYRLKQVDHDGKTSYSNIVYVNNAATSGNYSVFPNPIAPGSNAIQLKGIPASEVKYENISISNLAGQAVPYKITGANTIEMDPKRAPGYYFIKIKGTTLKLLKQ
ncbi:MAG: T9SS type A sorting domain-containing protein [Bacteroidetes bacterium]|nr:T9SS type A sorting domain-containing protein [Bacteroidota bacterium]